MVFILSARLKEKLNERLYRQYMDKLPVAIQQKINRFRFWQDAHRSLFGNLLLLECLKETGLQEQTLTSLAYTEYLRPYLDNVDFNISHSGELVVCAISKKNKIGIDVEEINKIPVTDFTEEFSAIEMAAITADTSLHYFYTLWTQKEAFLKAIGKGLSVPLNQVSVQDNQINWGEKSWFLHEIKLDEKYASHLCTDTPTPEIVIREMDFYNATNSL